jgi:hypothetical protein
MVLRALIDTHEHGSLFLHAIAVHMPPSSRPKSEIALLLWIYPSGQTSKIPLKLRKTPVFRCYLPQIGNAEVTDMGKRTPISCLRIRGVHRWL